MKSRVVTFFAEAGQLGELADAVDRRVLPQYSKLPEFLGFLLLKAEGTPNPEVLAISLWDDGLEGSEALSEEFVGDILEKTGMAPTRGRFDIMRAFARDTNGADCRLIGP